MSTATASAGAEQALANLGDEIRQLRRARGMTLQELAEQTGKSQDFTFAH